MPDIIVKLTNLSLKKIVIELCLHDSTRKFNKYKPTTKQSDLIRRTKLLCQVFRSTRVSL